jgi:hypothetical protein
LGCGWRAPGACAEAQQPARRIEQVQRDGVRHHLAHQLHDLELEALFTSAWRSRNSTHCGMESLAARTLGDRAIE